MPLHIIVLVFALVFAVVAAVVEWVAPEPYHGLGHTLGWLAVGALALAQLT